MVELTHELEVIVELEHVRSTPTTNLVQLQIVVVDGEFTSTGREDGCGDELVTSV